MNYHHREGIEKPMSFGKKLLLAWGALILAFMAYTIFQAFEVWYAGQYPAAMSYGQIVDAKNRCFAKDMHYTITWNTETSEVVAVDCKDKNL